MAPEATAAAADADGWHHTGDLASIDSLGYLRIEGRITDMIIRRRRQNLPPARSRTSCSPTPESPRRSSEAS
jgi:long-chain acyl-CoA synthetase